MKKKKKKSWCQNSLKLYLNILNIINYFVHFYFDYKLRFNIDAIIKEIINLFKNHRKIEKCSKLAALDLQFNLQDTLTYLSRDKFVERIKWDTNPTLI